MIKLELEFKSGVGGYSQAPRQFKQVARNENFAVYERGYDGKIQGHEVFKIKILKKGTQIFDKIVEEDTERYPGNNDFGRFAWSMTGKFSYEAAMHRFEQLTKGLIAAQEEEENPKEEVEEPVVVKPKKERQIRPAIKLPNSAKFTMSDVVELNQDGGWTKPTIYVDIQRQISAGIIKEDGKVVKEAGERGKRPILYSLVIPETSPLTS